MMTCQTFEQYLVDYLEGALSFELMKDADAHLQQCKLCRDELAQQRKISEQLRRLPTVQCPDRVFDSVFSQIERKQHHHSWHERFQLWFEMPQAWKMGVTVAAMLIVAVVALFYRGGESPPLQSTQYSAEELERAKREIELTLAYVNFYTQQTGHIVEQQLAATHAAVTQPVQDMITLQLQSTRKAITRPLEDEMLQPLNSLLHKYESIL